MAPEQARGEGDDASCDLFSLGACSTSCTRRLPFPGTTVIAVLTSLRWTPPLPLANSTPPCRRPQ